ncbi:MAG: hypothetical protein Q4C70_04870 [Planctomycetia bacterium]|nr:hypothetical protein [Planctomycetia bacterium]
MNEKPIKYGMKSLSAWRYILVFIFTFHFMFHFVFAENIGENTVENQLVSAIQEVRKGNYESALTGFKTLETTEFLEKAEPTYIAEYWFYRAVAEHQLILKEECSISLTRLETLESIPVRFSSLAKLMRKDLETLKEESLEMVSRRMKSVERRLDDGAAGEKVQKSEEEIVKMLDEMIDEMEEQAQKQKMQMSRHLKPGKPMKDAKIAGGNGPGNVTRRDLKYGENWGNLPEKEREAVLQQLGRDFPPHYRDAIEQYFKRMAEQE